MLIIPAEYARMRGVSAAAVYQAIKAGRISAPDGKIDPDVANREWEANRQRSPKIVDTGAPDAYDRPADGLPTLETSRRRREFHEANLAAMKERQRAGELVELAQVHLAYTTLAAQLRAALERIPDKLAPRLAAESDAAAIHDLLTAELDQALVDMAASAGQLPTHLMASAHDG